MADTNVQVNVAWHCSKLGVYVAADIQIAAAMTSPGSCRSVEVLKEEFVLGMPANNVAASVLLHSTTADAAN